MGISQGEIVKKYFTDRPNQVIAHSVVVPEVVAEYVRLTGRPFADPDRQIRTLHQRGFLQKIGNGLYKYDPEFVSDEDPEATFRREIVDQVFARDGYKCVVCGRGREQGLTLHADHIKARALGGLGTLENGQTLCAEHNILKKNFGQLEFGRKLFAKTLDRAIASGDVRMEKFCLDVIEVFDRHQFD
jgi:HNH endonuclease